MSSVEINMRVCSEAQEPNEVSMKNLTVYLVPSCLHTCRIFTSPCAQFGDVKQYLWVYNSWLSWSRTSLLFPQSSSGTPPLKSLLHCEFHGCLTLLPLTLLSVSTNIPVPTCSSPLNALLSGHGLGVSLLYSCMLL